MMAYYIAPGGISIEALAFANQLAGAKEIAEKKWGTPEGEQARKDAAVARDALRGLGYGWVADVMSAGGMSAAQAYGYIGELNKVVNRPSSDGGGAPADGPGGAPVEDQARVLAAATGGGSIWSALSSLILWPWWQALFRVGPYGQGQAGTGAATGPGTTVPSSGANTGPAGAAPGYGSSAPTSWLGLASGAASGIAAFLGWVGAVVTRYAGWIIAAFVLIAAGRVFKVRLGGGRR